MLLVVWNNMNNVKFESRKVNPSRLLFGLANIGYKPYAAIEDIIDNAVSAKAKNVKVIIDIFEGKTFTEKSNIERISVLDDGAGMDDEVIRKALDIGSDVNYEEMSLSKYGFGLKSAGLSLGKKITVVSKTQQTGFSNCLILDTSYIQNNGEYGVLVTEVSEEFQGQLSQSEHGTIVSISDISITDTANSLKNKLLSRLGAIYYEFISSSSNRLSIEVIINGKSVSIEPIDILHRQESLDSFDEYNYDCKTPCRVINGHKLYLSGSPEGVSPVIINATIFPQAKMASYPGFSPEEKENIKKYGVSGANSGFFIFRNGRLIRWGDNLGIIDRDLRTFRARIDITSEHDELLNVDVSKQNLVLPEEFLDDLSLICRIPKSIAKKAFDQCSILYESNDDREGEKSSYSVIDITEEDPITHIEPTDSNIKTERRKSMISSSSDEEIVRDEDGLSSISKIQYLDYLNNSNLWQTSLNPEYGTIVYINKSHQFYRLVLSNLKAADPKRQAIECFLYCVAVGENKTKENLASVDYEDIVKTLERFENVTSWNLQNWTAHNQDLFD
ncbi:hypothetical protein XV78_14605 [Vibrio cholerae]|nr:ATP-binding protein [Vibrio cholerae]KAA1209200.1 ATP-binding protein [Vibrio cholerae]KAA1222759.1 ATP-binding protein [Vibrio cholerae]KQA51787.1 hypothetical protein XV78_14605 [Vibrio cholerae]KQA60737.1 hypothetical protein XV81_16375 [Vibrio cholerae]